MIHLRSLGQFLRDVCAACRPAPADDTLALAEAVGVVAEPTPLADAAIRHLRDMLADWHDEVWALADVELAEMTRGDR